jgi:hypothetical protein
MDISQILAELERARGYFPEDAVRAAIERREEIIPHLLGILEQTIERAEELAADDARVGLYVAHDFAMHLLAQFREPRAYPLVIRLARLPKQCFDGLLDDTLGSDLPRVLASVCAGDLGSIKALIEDEALEPSARAAGVQALVYLVLAGTLPRQEALDYFAHLLRGGMPREDSAAWDGLVLGVLDIHPGELLADLRRAYDEGLGTTWGMEDWKTVEGTAKRPVEEVLAEARLLYGGLVEDTAAAMRSWACFEPKASADEDADGTPVPAGGLAATAGPGLPFTWPEESPPASAPGAAGPKAEAYGPSAPYVRPAPKVGRNDPCPCGSGKKYKKCCGR